ncbi:hypothetical protein LTR37_019764 [Vermiconidia calcicola]|uniref:Uncharacterized protein n=1 Tax=Vermiconidia calcicola TaxID=1690605 RepID=A0ACC3MEE9_9PEZI|nr:hypothetical protein LTR37_019764 [Vermiconidia calcicola]
MHRMKNIEYDEDDLYAEDEEVDGEEEQAYTDEDRQNFDDLTPVVRAELDEAGLQASDREIEEALYYYYWDVGKSVVHLKHARTPRPQQQQAKKEKAKSKFDQAAERSASKTGRSSYPSPSASAWFDGILWSTVPSEWEGYLIPVGPQIPRPKLLGGSSKLAKLAEERRKKAASSQTAPSVPDTGLSSLDRLSKPKDPKENVLPQHAKQEPKKYPIRKKRELTPPPKEPSPPPEVEPKEELPDLRASPTAFARTLSTGPSQAARTRSMALDELFSSSTNEENPFKGPSPDDTILRAQQHSKGLNNGKATKQFANGLAKKAEALKLDQTSSPTTPTQPKIKSKGLDVPKLWKDGKAKRKPAAAFVVIGHVDHGKSTLMGRLLLDTGAVSQRDIDKYKKQATELGKASFALAWVMDTGSEERERGVTVDIAQHHFSTDKVDFTILDAPGHRDFVPNMIGGASMADLAVLVVDANQLESGMKGQTREHILLAKACGLKRIVVAVNKLDSSSPPWGEATFEQVKDEVTKLLTATGFAAEDIAFVPCSGLNGQNVVTPVPSNGKTGWVASSSRTLLQELERSASDNVAEATIKASLRMQIADVFRGGITNPLSVSGRIATGNVQVGDSVIVQPSGETAAVRGIEASSDGVEWAVASQLCTLHLTDIEPQHLRAGDVLCSTSKPVPVVKSFVVQIQALESILPQGVDVHVGRLHTSGIIAALITTLDAQGELLKKKPRVVKAGQSANVKVVLSDGGAPLEVGDRVVLRANGSTVAAGKVERTGSCR